MDRPTPGIALPADATYEQMTSSVAASLATHGHATWPLPSCPLALDAWRRAARAGARSLGRPVRTVVTGDAVHAWLTDWPRDAHEQAVGVADVVLTLRDDATAAAPA